MWSAAGRETDAVGLVVAAHRRAPEHVRHHFFARDLVTAWLHRPVAGRPELQALARDLSPDRRQPNTNETGDPPHWTRAAASDEEGHPRS